ncbi:MAG: hypothetical protein R2712_10575 [Vicinamibacterales bacterium]
MTAARRTRASFARDRAIEHARALGKPLVILRCCASITDGRPSGYHQFVPGRHARQPRRAAATPGVTYHAHRARARPRARP